MKRCALCSFNKDESEFSKNSSRPDGLQTYCKPCFKEKYKAFLGDIPDFKNAINVV